MELASERYKGTVRTDGRKTAAIGEAIAATVVGLLTMIGLLDALSRSAVERAREFLLDHPMVDANGRPKPGIRGRAP
jgi:hypothetical protein